MRAKVLNSGGRFAQAGLRMFVVVVFTAVFLLGYQARICAALPSVAEVERAVLTADAGSVSLKETWQPVVRLLEDVTVQAPDPVLRMIKGHACLAANENNESVRLFLSVQTSEEKNRWLQWTVQFAERHDAVPIAQYFHGDALARLGRWNEAIDCFTAAIQQAPGKQHALSLNARGVLSARRHQWNDAIRDFVLATRIAPEFADAHSSFGFLWVEKRDGALGALDAFERAIENSPGAALPMYGRVAVRVVLGRYEETLHDIDLLILRKDHLGQLIRQRLIAAVRARQANSLAGAPVDDQAEAGSEVSRRVQTIQERFQRIQETGVFGTGLTRNRDFNVAVTEAMKAGRDGQQAFLDGMKALQQTNPHLAERAWQRLEAYSQHTDWGKDVLQRAQGIQQHQRWQASAQLGLGDLASLGVRQEGGLRVDYGRSFQGDVDRLTRNQQFYDAVLNTPHFETNPGGFKTSLAHATFDTGAWPFDALFGLCYAPRNGQRTPSVREVQP